MIFGRARKLLKAGVLGINQRNADFVLRYNSRRLYPLVDDKVRTKQLAMDAGMSVPELYGVVRSQHDVRNFREVVSGRPDFVIKPAHGSGGDGILVVTGTGYRGNYRTIDGQLVDEQMLRHHLSNIISGQYSLGGTPDSALVEACVRVDDVFDELTFKGVPDIRVLVFLGYPLMAMVRLPTRRSHGKANLHQGAVGAGIDMSTGITLGGVMDDRAIDEHPDTGAAISGRQVPGWAGVLDLSARAYELTGLGYLGVDIVLDRARGPVILELNARPGLGIQIASRDGLLGRLKRIEALAAEQRSPGQRIEQAREMFASSLVAGTG